MLAHVVDCATLESDRDPVSDIEALEAELSAYQPALDDDLGLGDLAGRPRIIVLNKIDIPKQPNWPTSCSPTSRSSGGRCTGFRR